MADFDLAVIGGGIHGCGIARDAAGRKLSVLLMEQGDLGGGTSSASSKLIHGGLRYLEYFDFRLVRESLAERARLLKLAPHLVRPMRFVLPVVEGGRSAWKLKLGFALYDWLAGPGLQKTRRVDLAADPVGVPLRQSTGLGFEYSDCVVDDARLVIANALSARELGATIRPRTQLVAARREQGRWHLILQSGGERETATARAIVNASGPWAARVVEAVFRRTARTRLRLVKGSHVVLPRLHAHDRAYFLQNHDGRLIFVIPYDGEYTLIGTTEVEVADPSHVSASAEEILYLCRSVGGFFRASVEPSRLKWTFSGVRALIDDGSKSAFKLTRDYRIEIDGRYGEPPLISVFGGKLTTYRRLAEKVMERLKSWIALGPPWTGEAVLPGGDLDAGGLDGLVSELTGRHPFLTEVHAKRLARAYGTRARRIVGEANSLEDLGPRYVADLYQAELDYLRREEWALTADDVLWRRSKLGLVAKADEIAALKAAFDNTPARIAAG